MSRWAVFILYAICALALGFWVGADGKQVFSEIWTCGAALTIHWFTNRGGA